VAGDRKSEINAELAELVNSGRELWAHDHLKDLTGNDFKTFADELKAGGFERPTRKSLKYLSTGYQGWYSQALRVVEQLLPDRLDEFACLYLDRRRKDITWETYGVSDYLSGTVISKWDGAESFDHQAAGRDRFDRQIQILKSARDRLESLLTDIRGVLEADLFDDELSAAEDLLKANHLRSAGVVAGVVLERHLKRVIGNHKVSFRKKPQLGNLNEALKTAEVYDVPQWRRVQRLADLRNLCGHDGEREPTKDEVEELVRGVEKVVATVF
jgi:hypothetical protein